MRYYFFDIAGDKIKEQVINAKTSALEYHHFEQPVGQTEIYYKLTSGKITNVICEAKDKDLALQSVEYFLLHYNSFAAVS